MKGGHVVTNFEDGDLDDGEQADMAVLGRRPGSAASSLSRAANLNAPELSRWSPTLGRVWLVAAVGLVVVLVTLAAVISTVDKADAAWVTGALLAAVLALTVVLCAHVGGHAWLVPVPAAALASVWAVTVGSGGASSALGWWLAGGTAAASGVAVLVALPALAHPIVQAGPGALRAAEGTALTPLSPTGVVRVAGELWTAESLSGPLPAGVPVHVVRVDGLRLLVWSEAGTVPGADAVQAEGGLE